jgi:ribose 5-phosphate isomerase B
MKSLLNGRRVALAGDHAGYALKEAIATMIRGMGGVVVDFGPESAASCDFPDHVGPAAEALSRGEVWRAILIDGAGYPSGIVANKHAGVYAAVANDHLSARLCREHSDANALCLGGQVVGPMVGQELARLFLTTEFLGGKYAGRVAKVKSIESRRQAAPAAEAPLKVVSLEDVQRALRDGLTLSVAPGARLTPSAEDILKL